MSSSLLTCIACLIFCCCCCCAEALADTDVAENAEFKNYNYPWYNEQTKGYQPIKIPGKKPEPVSPNTGSAIPTELPIDLVSQVVRILFWGLIILIVVWLIVMIVRALRDYSPVSEETITENQELEVTREKLNLLPEVTRGVQDFLKESKAYAIKGEYGKAMIYYYAWQLIKLDQLEVIELECGKTNRQYLQEARKNLPELRETFKISIQHFEAALYGGISLLAEDFEAVWDQRSIFTTPPAAKARKKTAQDNFLPVKQSRRS